MMMHKKIIAKIKSFWPSSIDDDTSISHDTILELLFFLIIDRIRSICRSKKERGTELLFDKSINMMIIFIALFVSTIAILAYPLLIATDDLEVKLWYIFQVFSIIFVGSLSWTAFVYVTQDFKILGKTKIYPLVTDSDSFLFFLYSLLLDQFYKGSCLKWQSGQKIRFFWRSLFGEGFVLVMLSYLYPRMIQYQTSTFLAGPEVMSFFNLLVTLLPLIITLFFVFVILFIMMTIPLTLVLLLIGVWILPVEIKPFINMGDTQIYGDTVINCLYSLAIAIGLMPLLTAITQIDFPKLQIYNQLSEKFHNLTAGNATVIIKNAIDNSFSLITFDSFSKFLIFIYLYIICILLSLCILWILHYHIKKKKDYDIKRLEGMISDIDFIEPGNFLDRDRNQYLLSLYQKVLNLHEWPVKRFFILDMIISALLLFISRLFGV
jgi:hypothetical protein